VEMALRYLGPVMVESQSPYGAKPSVTNLPHQKDGGRDILSVAIPLRG